MAYSPLFYNALKNNNHHLRVTYKGVQRREKRRLEESNEQAVEEHARKKQRTEERKEARKELAKQQAKRQISKKELRKAPLPKMAMPPPEKLPSKPATPAWQKNIAATIICRECQIDPPNVTEEYSSGDLVCMDCGLVLGDRIIDTRSEWRTFSNDDQGNDDPSRVGQESELSTTPQLQTNISFGAGGAAARDLHRAQNKVNQDKGAKQLGSAYKDIGELCDNWQLTKNITDTAKHLYKMTHDSGAFRGKSQDAVIAGCIFIACRQCNAPRTFRETFALTKVSKKEIGKIFKQLETLFKKENALKAQEQIEKGRAINPDLEHRGTDAAGADKLLFRYANQLQLDQTATNVAVDVAKKMDQEGILAGRSPLSQCAASLYFASHLMGQALTETQISAVLGISAGTIKTVYKHLYQAKDLLVDPKWLKPNHSGDVSNLPQV